MIDLAAKLKFWMNGPQARAAAKAAAVFWGRVEGWLDQSLAQADIRVSTAEALRQHAEDRGVARLPGETEPLWRERVRHAITVAQNSGTRAGLEYILGVYGVTAFSIEERVAGEDWDVIRISLNPDALSGADTAVLDRVFQEWGRVCRRYVMFHLQTSVQTVFSGQISEITNYGRS